MWRTPSPQRSAETFAEDREPAACCHGIASEPWHPHRKKVQHNLIRYNLAGTSARPFLVGPGTRRGIMMLQGRSRLAIYADRTWPQLLQWRRDLESWSMLRNSCWALCAQTSLVAEAKGSRHIRTYPRAREAVVCFAQRMPLEDEDVQFLMCELSRGAGSVLLGRPRST